MAIQNVRFVCACRSHGLELSDGTKNECCDAAIIMPMLGEAELQQLVPAGREQYEQELLQLSDLVESGGVDRNLSDEFRTWYETIGYPPIEGKQVETAMANEVAAEDQDVYEDEHGEEVSMEELYMDAFSKGFALGFSKGYDTASELSLIRAARMSGGK